MVIARTDGAGETLSALSVAVAVILCAPPDKVEAVIDQSPRVLSPRLYLEMHNFYSSLPKFRISATIGYIVNKQGYD